MRTPYPGDFARLLVRPGRTAMLTILLLALVAVLPRHAHAGIVPTGLVGYWAGNNNANDSSVTANHGAFAGSYVSTAFGEAFDLNTGQVTVPDHPVYSFGSSDVSIGFWFNHNGQPSDSVVFLGQDNGPGGTNKWFIDYGYGAPGAFELHLNGSGGFAFIDSNAVSLPIGWNQFTLVRSGASFQFFLDGTSIGTVSSGANFSDPTAPLIFGFAEPAVGQYHGLMDDVVIYNRALTPAEVQELTRLGPEPGTLILVAGAAIGLLLARRRCSVR
jgi:hypothetical protein